MKGVILAGGTGTRLMPLTKVVSKQLLPVYDKPVIYYPLSTLIHAGVTEVLIISTPRDISYIENLLEDGSHLGIKIHYLIQEFPRGLADGVRISEEFTNGEKFWFILGDNLFHGPDFGVSLQNHFSENIGSTVFAYRVADPRAYGVVEFDKDGSTVTKLTEKPDQPNSNWVIPGLYIFDGDAPKLSATIKPSLRGELEIIDLLDAYLCQDRLNVRKISRGNAWFDLGTSENLLIASQFVHSIQTRQGQLVGSPEEASFNAQLIDNEHFRLVAQKFEKNDYGKNLFNILET